MPNPEPPTDSNTPAQSESHSSEDGQFNWSGQLDPGQMVRVYNGTGDMVVTQSAGQQVEVVAIKSSVNSDPESVTFRVVEGEFGVLICTIYPDAPGELPQKCDTEAVTITQGDNDVSVRYEIRIPSELLADINTITGNIQGLGLDIPFKGRAVNGNSQDVQLCDR